MNTLTGHQLLDLAHIYAKAASGCTKVQVGAIIVKDGQIVSIGANRCYPDLCRTARGCLRVEKHGDNAKEHRLPADCRAVHSEIDAISRAPVSLHGTTIYVTRYPCEACARAICAAGIKAVYYGRKQHPTMETMMIFEDQHVSCFCISNWDAEDTTV